MVKNRAQWMADGLYGLMVHYLLQPLGDTEADRTRELERLINGFDLDTFIQQFRDSGADWLIFTIGQNTGYYNSPNATLDRLLPGRTPRRDLVLEIARRVKRMGKRFIAYLPAEISAQQPEVKRVFQWNDADQRLFLSTYLAFVRDYSRQYGRFCDGWWFDGCYEPIHRGRWNWAEWAAAARAGNPYSIVAFNDGAFCVGLLKPVSLEQDYHAGEVHLLENGKIRIDPLNTGDLIVDAEGHVRRPGQQPQYYMPDSQFIDGVQWHALVPVDSSFVGDSIPMEHLRYSAEYLARFIQDCRKVRGAVTINLPIGLDGVIPSDSARKARELGALLRRG